VYFLTFDAIKLMAEYEIAPDGSEIRPLLSLVGGSLAHCTLKPSMVSMAISHKTVDEIWYILEGEGEIWRKKGDAESVLKVKSGYCLTIPKDTSFQFKCKGDIPFSFLIVTIPPWPGDKESIGVKGHWQ
jgi:mannose-6-phosphate isomerase-like protein (cupin superfamily)